MKRPAEVRFSAGFETQTAFLNGRCLSPVPESVVGLGAWADVGVLKLAVPVFESRRFSNWRNHSSAASSYRRGNC